MSSSGMASSSIWGQGTEDVLWSQRDENDEEALQWAVLQKLPTYDRMKKGLLAEVGGAPKETEIQQLGFQEKKELLNRLVNTGALDNEQFLSKLRERIDRVGINIPTIEVRYEHLSIKAKARIGARALPSIFNSVRNTIEPLLHILNILPSSERTLSILNDIGGIIKPGRMTLLLGPPGSGKTTLLLALAGNLDKHLKVSGKVTYNGHEMGEFVPQRTSAYISQTDLHTPEMTVRETLAFSARCQGVGTNYDMLVELLRREKAANIKPDMDVDIYMKAAAVEGQEVSIVTDYILKILGLENCADTMVGSAMIRGISGGEKKRLTTGEMLVGPVKAFFMDEISTGLDTSTTFQIVKAIKHFIHILRGTAVITLLQPEPEIYELFDDIILLSDGHIVYQGPCENVLEFFEHMGFRCPQRKCVADFLQEVTSRKEQQQYSINNDEQAYKFVTVKEFAEAFKSFCVGQKLEQELDVPFDKNTKHPASLVTKKYGLNKREVLKACTTREILLLKRNSFIHIFKAMELSFTAIIEMTLFFHTKMPKRTVTDGGIFMGALFFTITRMMFNGYAEIFSVAMELPVFFKQRDFLLFPAWAYSLPKWILRTPISAIQPAIWVLLTYYEIGFDSDIGRFFKQYLLLVWLQQMATGLFRFIGGLGRDIFVAGTYGACALMLIMSLGGFVLSRENVKSWWIWGYWISPMTYAQNSIAVNEFLGKSWSHVPPNAAESLGVLVLKSRGIFPEPYWYWLGVGALFGFSLLFNFLFTLAITYLNPLGKSKAILPKESLEDDADENNKSTELSLRNKHSSERRGDALTRHESKRPHSAPIDQANLNRRQGMVLPFQPSTMTFDEMRYAIDMPERMKAQGIIGDQLELLKGISGAFRPGVLTALMGVSGAGKTTLMDVLAGRKTGGYIKGTIKISGYPKKQETFARISGYVEQADIHSPHLTVYESILFSAWLRLPREVDSETREMFVEEVMELVELTSIRDAIVGLPGVDGLSTEQRKRLTISVELIANPSIIFMDEPTSGLDARAAAIVMRAVKNTVNTGRTVVCTIHQPSIDIFDGFDELLLLKQGGEEIYFGPLGQHACHLINYFEGIEGVAKIMDGYNPASWMLKVSSAAEEAKLGVNFAETYKKSELHRRTKELIGEINIPAAGSEDLYFATKYSQSFISQCLACLWKQHWSYWRNTQYNTIRLVFSGILGLLLGLIFWDLGSKREREQDLFNAMGSMYAAVLFLGIRNASSVQPVIDVERTVFYRERAAGMYSALPYAFGQVVIELPYGFIQTIIYGIIVYVMIGFELTATKFFWYIYFMYFTLLCFTYYGMMAIAISPNFYVSSVISSSFYSIWNLFSGFVVPQTRMPIWWRWYYWACPMAWTLYGLVVSQYGDIEHRLNNGQTVEKFVKSHFGFRHDLLGVVATMMIIFPVVFAFVFAFSIRSFNFQRR